MAGEITNKEKFMNLHPYWITVKAEYLRELPEDIKDEFERIYKAEVDPRYFANKYCKKCYYTLIENLIKFYQV